jgi:hypothetical protein
MMKKLLVIFSISILLIVSCKKTGMSPVGPTDIRVKNLSDVPMTNVTVNTFDSTFNYGALGPGDTTEYHRFDRAYPKAYITATINSQTFKTDTVYYTYQNYLSTVKATYQIYIKNEAQRKLEISNVVLDSELK